MTLDELRALLTPDRLDEIAAHNCGASEVALGLASALVDALIERDTLRAGVERLTAGKDEAEACRAFERVTVAEQRLAIARLTAERDAADNIVRAVHAWLISDPVDDVRSVLAFADLETAVTAYVDAKGGE